MQPKDIVTVFNQFCEDSQLNLERIGSIQRISQKEGILGTEKRINLNLFATANLNEQFELNGSDIVTGKLVLNAPFKYGQGYQISVMAIRKVCTNGQHLPVTLKRKILSHVTKFPVQEIMAVLEGAKTLWKQYETQSVSLSNTEVSHVEAVLLLLSQFSRIEKNQQLAKTLLNKIKSSKMELAKAEDLIWDEVNLENESKIVQSCYNMYSHNSFIGAEMASAKNTAWGLLNTVTEFCNHHSVAKNANVQINSLWNGSKQRQTQSFLQSISAFAHEAKNRDKSKLIVSVPVRAF